MGSTNGETLRRHIIEVEEERHEERVLPQRGDGGRGMSLGSVSSTIAMERAVRRWATELTTCQPLEECVEGVRGVGVGLFLVCSTGLWPLGGLVVALSFEGFTVTLSLD